MKQDRSQVYVVPYLIVNAWLVTITLLQHTCAQSILWREVGV